LEQKQKGKLVLITSHILSDLEEFTTDVVYLQEGKILFQDTLKELQKKTGEAKLSKAIASLMKEMQQNEVTYLKLANY
ncbi:MAG TPA: hypothetical protein VGD26_07020, partial [Chitinophagaceae bacterium]